MPATPVRHPAPAFDVFNVLFERIYDPTIHLLFTLDGEVDEAAMREATQRLIAANPYLGSRFAVVDGLPVWEEIPPEQWEGAFVIVAGTADDPPAPLDVWHGPQVRVTLYRDGGRDRIAVTCHHGFCDAHGAATLAEQVFAAYRGIMDDPAFRPDPTGAYDRSTDRILALYSEEERRQARDAEEPFVDRWRFPNETTGRGTPRVVHRTLPPERLARAKELGRRHGATVNDVLIGAFFLALMRIRRDPSDPGSPRSILTSADLRRHLGDLDACPPMNLSVAFDLPLVLPGEGAGLADIIGDVAAATARRKAENLGLGCILFYEDLMAGGMPAVEAFFDTMLERYQSSGQKNPVFSNLGIIDPDEYLPVPGKAGADLGLCDVRYLPCVCRPYGFLMTAATFRGRMTLTAAYEEGPYAAATVERFLAYVDAYLP
ncbi:condensation protein [Methanoculleus sp. FWC-SCC1]|uniref:Condensation protein n=1 Tax=Methanoculleus frigidifontis TaxID=2584085 RepID=A0ABT8M7C2_9EURY|nr:condensation protein [Methanoculleus sp. FWC-SCC1]MDN7023821.1 condensation protein [Methanoculleus sp. FWC-SCC1]